VSKVETIDALLESAIRCFSQYGYDGASLRDIAAGAGVPLSTIDMYFGSKADLYVAVNQKVWSEIDQERRQLLQAALTKQPSGPQLSDIVYALALPVVARALSHSKHDAARVMILRRPVGGRLNADVGAALEDAADRSIVRWIDSIAHSCPTLSRQDVVWAYSFIIAAIYSWQLIDHRYDRLLGQHIERTAEDVVADIVAFGCAGVQAMIDRRTTSSVNK